MPGGKQESANFNYRAVQTWNLWKVCATQGLLGEAAIRNLLFHVVNARHFKKYRKLLDCYFVCPSGCLGAEVFCSARLHIILWQAAVQRWRSYQTREVHILLRCHSPSIMCFQSLLYPSVLVLEDWTDNHSSSPASLPSSIHSHIRWLLKAIFFFFNTNCGSVFLPVLLLHCDLQTPSVGIMTTINSIFTNVIKLILCSMRGLFLNSSWYAYYLGCAWVNILVLHQNNSHWDKDTKVCPKDQ